MAMKVEGGTCAWCTRGASHAPVTAQSQPAPRKVPLGRFCCDYWFSDMTTTACRRPPGPLGSRLGPAAHYNHCTCTLGPHRLAGYHWHLTVTSCCPALHPLRWNAIAMWIWARVTERRLMGRDARRERRRAPPTKMAATPDVDLLINRYRTTTADPKFS